MHHRDCRLPATGWGTLTLAAACPRTASARTSTSTPCEPRGLKHRPEGTIRTVPIPPALVTLLRRHLASHGTTPDQRLFRGTKGGMLSESPCARTWHTARTTAPGPELAATPLARRPCDLRHAAPSLWLTATTQPAEIAARAGNSPRVLHDTCTHIVHGHSRTTNQQIEQALRHRHNQQPGADCRTAASPVPVRQTSVTNGSGPATAHSPMYL